MPAAGIRWAERNLGEETTIGDLPESVFSLDNRRIEEFSRELSRLARKRFGVPPPPQGKSVSDVIAMFISLEKLHRSGAGVPAFPGGRMRISEMVRGPASAGAPAKGNGRGVLGTIAHWGRLGRPPRKGPSRRGVAAVALVATALAVAASRVARADGAPSHVFPVAIGDRWGYIDAGGKVVVPAAYDYAQVFSDGVGLVLKDGKFGYVDAKGEMVIPMRFDGASAFVDGYALYNEGGTMDRETTAVEGGRWGLIDRSGKVVVPARFESLQRPSEGIFAFMEDDLWGYMGVDGTLVSPPRFDTAGPFRWGLGMVSVGGAPGYVDAKGRMVWPAQASPASAGAR